MFFDRCVLYTFQPPNRNNEDFTASFYSQFVAVYRLISPSYLIFVYKPLALP